ncbi:uncharacterized protein (TIGR02646 family) [Flavobacterium endophyticum]|uniref:Uncharacterized protein (TIGR02646 family) n=1 Tax=Flavobacterium endophyticum TaxID=1540163 RepID=A0A495MDD4_9FLAO|nr:HNH endonuclease domain-containing protein [Flavobacterium endophyticum]RKS23360.1 uncharacterized protein (TIGR02646 family) [Flavobacterium endophyticum]
MKFTEDDFKNIKKAIDEGGKIWENKILLSFKKKFKSYYRSISNDQCCYCKRDIKAEFKMVIDIEHILPKSEFVDLMFDVINLSVSCKRCNMNIKKEDYSFVKDSKLIKENHLDKDLYKIIHPNLDSYFDHLNYNVEIVNELKIVKYRVVGESEKGDFTYKYFKLFEFEIDLMNHAQGIVVRDELSELIDFDTAKEIKELLNKLKAK